MGVAFTARRNIGLAYALLLSIRPSVSGVKLLWELLSIHSFELHVR